MNTFTVKKQVRFAVERKGEKKLYCGKPVAKTAVERLPRVTRMMALAIRFDDLIRRGIVADQAEIARLGYVSRARVTQIMDLLQFAPDIQEKILFLPAFAPECNALTEKLIRPIAITPDWNKQRSLWHQMFRENIRA